LRALGAFVAPAVNNQNSGATGFIGSSPLSVEYLLFNASALSVLYYLDNSDNLSLLIILLSGPTNNVPVGFSH
jgi:hypothetical protein